MKIDKEVKVNKIEFIGDVEIKKLKGIIDKFYEEHKDDGLIENPEIFPLWQLADEIRTELEGVD